MNLIFALLTSGLVGEAQAKKRRNPDEDRFRAKISTPILLRESVEVDSDGNDPDPVVTSGISFLTGPARGELTYMLGDGLEIGGMLGFSSLRTDSGGDDDASQGSFLLAATGAYNFRLDRDIRGFVQPLAGFSRESAEIGSQEQEAGGMLLGVGVGARFRYLRRASVDLSGEYNFQRLNPEIDGEDSDDDYRVNTIMLRLGLSGIL